VADKPHFHGHRQRLRQRFLDGGGPALPDYELLELLLCGAIPRGDMKPLAKALLARFGDFAAVISAPPERLLEADGVGEAVVAALKVVEAAAGRLALGRLKGRSALSSWNALQDYLQVAMGHDRAESFRVLYLDRKNHLLADEVQQRGTVDHAPVYPREVVKRALDLGATALIMVHNHPSGDPTPSRADIEMTRQVIEASRAMGIVVHDHIVVGHGESASFKALGLI
jgi:DNA repair protein RadC